MKWIIRILRILAVLAAVLTAAIWMLYAYLVTTEKTQSADVMETIVETIEETAAETEPPETINTDDMEEYKVIKPMFTGEVELYRSEESTLKDEPGVSMDQITGRIYSGYAADIYAMPMNWAACRNLTMDGVDMDVPVNLLFNWEEMKQLRPGDGVMVNDKLILVEDVLTEEDLMTPGLMAINSCKYYFRHHPPMYGGGELGWGTTEADCLFIYDLYSMALTAVPDVHLDFNTPNAFYFSIGSSIVSREEFVNQLSGKRFRATASYGTEFGMLEVDRPELDIAE